MVGRISSLKGWIDGDRFYIRGGPNSSISAYNAPNPCVTLIPPAEPAPHVWTPRGLGAFLRRWQPGREKR